MSTPAKIAVVATVVTAIAATAIALLLGSDRISADKHAEQARNAAAYAQCQEAADREAYRLSAEFDANGNRKVNYIDAYNELVSAC